ncbi:hypothetical protein ACSBR2_013708 [Camellia fascicularis]
MGGHFSIGSLKLNLIRPLSPSCSGSMEDLVVHQLGMVLLWSWVLSESMQVVLVLNSINILGIKDIMCLSWQSLCMTEIRIQVGNPETNDYYDYKGLLEYAWSHSVISDQEFENAKKVCNFKVFDWSGECNAAMSVVFEKYNEIDIYNIYAPICLLNTSGSGSDSDIFSSKTQNYGLRRMRIGGGGGYDPCYSTYTQHYFNRVDVQTSLHANTRGGANGFVNWNVCNNSVLGTYNFTVFSVLPIYTKLIKGGLKIWIYSGDTDGRVPVIGSRYCIEALRLPLKSPWCSWYHNQQVGGRIVEYEGLTYVTVRGAGHLVPLNKPSQALSLIHSFLSGKHLPTQR